jgi:hypothetical protein
LQASLDKSDKSFSFSFIARNSIYSHIAATSHGLSTIHSTRSEELFLNEFHQRLYPYTSAMYLSNVAATKVAFWLEIICCFHVLVVAASLVWLKNKGLNNEIDSKRE